MSFSLVMHISFRLFACVNPADHTERIVQYLSISFLYHKHVSGCIGGKQKHCTARGCIHKRSGTGRGKPKKHSRGIHGHVSMSHLPRSFLFSSEVAGVYFYLLLEWGCCKGFWSFRSHQVYHGRSMNTMSTRSHSSQLNSLVCTITYFSAAFSMCFFVLFCPLANKCTSKQRRHRNMLHISITMFSLSLAERTCSILQQKLTSTAFREFNQEPRLWRKKKEPAGSLTRLTRLRSPPMPSPLTDPHTSPDPLQ